MEKNKVYDVNRKPAIVLEAKDDTAIIFILTNAKNGSHTMTSDNTKRAVIDRIPVESLKPYKCPFADDTDPARIYCKNGECHYPIPEGGYSHLMYMCDMLCLNDSFNAELKEE